MSNSIFFKSNPEAVGALLELVNQYNEAMAAGDKDKAKAIADKSDEVGRDKMLYQATVFENLIKDEGFIGYYSNNASLGLTAAIYQPLSVKPAKDKEFSAYFFEFIFSNIAFYKFISPRTFKLFYIIKI